MACFSSGDVVVLLAAILAFQVNIAQAQSSATYVTARKVNAESPASMTVSHATEVVVTIQNSQQSGATDCPTTSKLDLQKGSCSVNPTINLGSSTVPHWTVVGSCTNGGANTAQYKYTFTLSPVGADWKLCFMNNAGGTRQEQTGMDVEVVAATTTTRITAISPVGMYANLPYNIQLMGLVNPGDRAVFIKDSQTCAVEGATALNAATDLTSTGTNPTANSFQYSATGIYNLCYRDHKGSDEVKQGSIILNVASVGGTGSDPVSWYGDQHRVFELPPRVLVPLIEASDMRLSGETFSYGGDWQQWFGRMVLFAPDESRWVEIRIKKNILDFNRSRIPQYAKANFETLQVTLGHGPVDNPSVTTDLASPDVKIPLSFLGFDVVFWKMARNAKVSNTMIGTAHRECMEVAGANLHFYVCSSAAHEFWGWQRDLSIINAHLDLAVLELLEGGEVKGLLPELWGMQPLSERAKSYITYDSGEDSTKNESKSTGLAMPAQPQRGLPEGKAWAGGADQKDLLQACIVDNYNKTVLGCGAPYKANEANDTISVNILSV